jgi:CRISPR/Cas system-associated protein Cas5 (RAMP superfamily)
LFLFAKEFNKDKHTITQIERLDISAYSDWDEKFRIIIEDNKTKRKTKLRMNYLKIDDTKKFYDIRHDHWFLEQYDKKGKCFLCGKSGPDTCQAFKRSEKMEELFYLIIQHPDVRLLFLY